MKNILTGIICFTAFSLFSQKPEIVYSIAKERKEIAWYETQQDLWKELTVKNPQNGEAWINYYMATRALRNLSEGEKREQYFKEAETIVAAVDKAMPETFESNFIAYSNDGIWADPAPLLKAEKLRADDVRIYDELMLHHEVTGNVQGREKYALKLYEAGELPSGTLNWAYNVLAELDENAVIFTVGDNDTYALWMVQAVKNFHKDVTVVNTSLIQLDDYRNALLKKLGYAAFSQPFASLASEEEMSDARQKLFQHFFNGKRPVYISTTAIGAFGNWDNNLFLTGLTYKYSAESIDNVGIIKRNYENRYLLDYLDQVFAFNIGDKQALYFNGTYLASMIRLHGLYKLSEDTQRMAALERLMQKIAKESGQEAELQEALEKQSAK